MKKRVGKNLRVDGMIDSHAHVAFYQFDGDREAVIARAREANVKWIEVGTDIEQSKKAITLHDWVTVGVHPSDIAEGVDWEEVRRLAAAPNVVAIGEVGIDLHHQDNLEEQLEALTKFVGLAREKDLPVVFHVRNPVKSPGGDHGASAHDEMIKFLREHQGIEGVMHTFSGTKQQAQQYLELGMYLSFSGVVTFPNAGEIAEVAKTMPLDRMLVETDCPFLAPQPVRGKRNEPAYVKYVVEKIAQLRGISSEEVEKATEENTRNLFRLK